MGHGALGVEGAGLAAPPEVVVTEVGRVSALYRYPVKSMLGEEPDSVRLDAVGIVGDRSWAVYDHTRGDFFPGKRGPALMNCRASGGEDGRPPRITLPDGTSFSVDAAEAAERLGALMGLKVSLWPIDPGDLPPCETPEEEIDRAAEYLAITARVEGEAQPDFSVLPDSIRSFGDQKRRPYVDLAPLMVMTQQSVDAIAAAAPDSKVDVRRFRPSILLDAPEGGAFPEQGWVGGRFQLGEAIVAVDAPCPRCVMTTHGFADLPKDPTVMRTLVRVANGDLGVYTSVEQPGRVRVGDALVRIA